MGPIPPALQGNHEPAPEGDPGLHPTVPASRETLRLFLPGNTEPSHIPPALQGTPNLLLQETHSPRLQETQSWVQYHKPAGGPQDCSIKRLRARFSSTTFQGINKPAPAGDP